MKSSLMRIVLLAVMIFLCQPGFADTITKLTEGLNGESADNASTNPDISLDGTKVVFESFAANLVDNDFNGFADVFLLDKDNNTLTLISAPTNANGMSNNYSANAVISGSGQYVAFESMASNLVENDNNNVTDIFVYDTLNNTMERVSVSSNGAESTSHSFKPSISSDGRFVTFYSIATNLVPDDTNRMQDVFLHDRVTASTTRISVNSNGTQANGNSWWPKISDNGEFIVFTSSASNLDSLDTNNHQDIYIHSISLGTTRLLSKTQDNIAGNGPSTIADISSSGDIVAFQSAASNFVTNDSNGFEDIFVVNVSTGEITRASQTIDNIQTNDHSRNVSISGDGTKVSYFTAANTLLNGDDNAIEDVYLTDLSTNTVHLISKNTLDIVGNGNSFFSAVDNTGSTIVFSSYAYNLIDNDFDTVEDIFLYTKTNERPLADAGSDQTVFLGDSVSLDGSMSSDPENDPIVAYSWALISTPELSSQNGWNSNQPVNSFIPDVEGLFVFSLIVNDGTSDSLPDEVFINVQLNQPPTAVINADIIEGTAPLVVHLDSTQSSDPENSNLLYTWDFGDGTSSQDPVVQHVYQAPGTYLVLLTVTDESGLSSDASLTITVTSENQPPVINVEALLPLSGPAPLTVAFEVTGFDPDGDLIQYSWNFGDGYASSNPDVTHIYQHSGSYVATLSATDGTFVVNKQFIVTVDTSSTINVNHAKFVFNHNKPHKNKLKIVADISFPVEPNEMDIITVTIGDYIVFSKTLGEFHLRKYHYYRDRNLLIKLNLESGNLVIFHNRSKLTESALLSNLSLTLIIGDKIAITPLQLSKKSICRYSDDYSGSNKSSDNCRYTIYWQ